MKTFTIATALALALPAIAQTVTDLPQCAQQPILLAISASGCGLTDIPCICANSGFVSGLLQTIPTVCNPSEVAIVSGFAVRLCGAAGVTLSLPADVVSATTVSAPSTLSAATTTSAASTSSIVATVSSTVSVTSTASVVSTPVATLSTTSTARLNSTTSSRAASTSSSSVPANEGTLRSVGFAGLVGALALGVVGL